jgi:hypothetical protein
MQINANTSVDKVERLPERLSFARDLAVFFLYNNGYDYSELAQIFKIKRQHCEYIVKKNLRASRER